MNTQHITPRFHHRLHLYLLRRLVIFANVMGLSTYLFLRIIFYDLSFLLQDEFVIALRIIAWSTGIAVGISFLIFAGHGLSYLIRNRKPIKFPSMMHVGETSTNKNRAM